MRLGRGGVVSWGDETGSVTGSRRGPTLTRIPCVVCGARVPLENLRLYYHVLAHKAGILFRKA